MTIDLDRIIGQAGLNGQQQFRDPLSGLPFDDPILCSALRKMSGEDRWLWHGCIARGGITQLSALWKAGKSTLIAHLLRSLEAEGDFCGRQVRPARVLYVTEEPQDIWADRRDELALHDHIRFQVRPFPAKPFQDRWGEFFCHLKAIYAADPYDLLVFDTISELWPVRDENDAARVQQALQPLKTLPREVAVLIVHHLRKGDGTEFTAARGSGAFSAFVDILLELRRYNPGDKTCKRRVITGEGRYNEVPKEFVVELRDGQYVAIGDKCEAATRDLRQVLLSVLPAEAPGMTYDEVAEAWPGETSPKRQTLLAALHAGAERGDWRQEGKGRRGSPWRWWIYDGSKPFPVLSPYRDGTENGNEPDDLEDVE